MVIPSKDMPIQPERTTFRPLDEKIFEKSAEKPDTAEPGDTFMPGDAPAKTISKSGDPGINTKAVHDEGLSLPPREWTVLTYFNGNCDLQSDMKESMKALEKVGSDEKIAFVAQFAHGNKGGKAERLLLKQPGWFGSSKSEVLADLGKTDMAHPQTLKDFVSWGMQKFPAQHYMLVMNGHGMGFIGSMPDDHSGDLMLTPELKSALDVATKEAGKKIDVLGFDSCLMANAETAYAVKDSANFMVASEEVLISGNWDYGEFAGKMKEEANGDGLTVGEALEAVIKSQYNNKLLTASVISCMAMPQFAEKLADFSQKLLATDTPPQVIRGAFNRTQHYCQEHILAQASNGDVNTKPMDQMRDVASVALEVGRARGVQDLELKKSALELAKFTTDKAVLFEMHRKNAGLSDSSGISIYAPASEGEKFAEFYDSKISLAQDTGWGKVIKKFGV
jgi:hypothetical protein